VSSTPLKKCSSLSNQQTNSSPLIEKAFSERNTSSSPLHSLSQSEENLIIVIDSDEESQPEHKLQTSSSSLSSSFGCSQSVSIVSTNKTNEETFYCTESCLEFDSQLLSTNRTNSVSDRNGTNKNEETCHFHNDLSTFSISSQSNDDMNVIPHYYLRNFFMVVNIVCEKDRHLFNENELEIIERFKKLDESSQRLYIRLFNRKGPWFQVSFHFLFILIRTFQEIMYIFCSLY
jgi:hypothetical protein